MDALRINKSSSIKMGSKAIVQTSSWPFLSTSESLFLTSCRIHRLLELSLLPNSLISSTIQSPENMKPSGGLAWAGGAIALPVASVQIWVGKFAPSEYSRDSNVSKTLSKFDTDLSNGVKRHAQINQSPDVICCCGQRLQMRAASNFHLRGEIILFPR